MKTLFANLLFNHRFIYQQAAPNYPEDGPVVEHRNKPENFDQMIESLGPDFSDEAMNKFVDKQTKETEEKGAKEKDKSTKDAAALDIDKYLKPAGERPPSAKELDELSTKIAKASLDKILGKKTPETEYVLSGGKTPKERALARKEAAKEKVLAKRREKVEQREEAAKLARRERAQEKGRTEALARLKEMDKEADKLTFLTKKVLTEGYNIDNGMEKYSTSLDKLNAKDGLGKELTGKLSKINERFADDPMLRLAANKEIYNIANGIKNSLNDTDRDRVARNVRSLTNNLEETINGYFA